MLNYTSLIASIKNKLIYYLLKNNLKNKEKIIMTLLIKLIKCIIPKTIEIKHKTRVRKRPQKNYYNSNVS
jgi:cell division protein FtsL